MPNTSWLQGISPAFRLMIATSWLAPASWQDHQEEAIREAIGANVDWIEFIRLVDRHRTPALSWAALKRVPGLEIPDQATKELQKRSQACRMQGLKHSMLLAEVLRALNGAGIPAMSLKGTILSFDLYGDVGLRQSKDLDLEIPLESLSQAMNCLAGLGWHTDPEQRPLTPRQWNSFLRHEQHIALVNSSNSTLELELHWRCLWEAPGKPSTRWARSSPSLWQGCTRQVMHPIDLVLYLSSHGGEHYWFRAKWLGDMARIHALGLTDWRAALDQARATNQTGALVACLVLLKDVHGLARPDLPKEAWRDAPPFLVENSLKALCSAEGPPTSPLSKLKNLLTSIRNAKLANPQTTWREIFASLAYSRADFNLLHLPDSLFCAYAPLRPVLGVWRFARQRRLAKRLISKPAP